MTRPWYGRDMTTAALKQFGIAAAGLSTGLLVADMVDRFIKTRRGPPGRLWMKIPRPRRPTPARVIAAAFAARNQWLIDDQIYRLRSELEALHSAIAHFQQELPK